MENDNRDYKQKIFDLLDNYEEGRNIFIKADDWDYPVVLKSDAKGPDLPDTWLGLADKVISIIAQDKYGMDTYPNEMRILSSQQMLDIYVSHGMPVNYNHWSFGKAREQMGDAFERGEMGLAYEMVINSNPSIGYYMTHNSKTMQLLTTAHAAYGHNDFFKNNYMFKQFTDAGQILGDLRRLKEYVEECEVKYGVEEVEKVLDACHTLERHAIDRYTRPAPKSAREQAEHRARIEESRLQSVDAILDSTRVTPRVAEEFQAANDDGVIPVGEENLLRFIATYGPHLKPWQRNLMNMICDKAQYFYPQIQTKVMNEGWASTAHYEIMEDLYDLGLIDDGMFMEFKKSHSDVLFQPSYDKPYYNGINPYVLGFNIVADMKRICLNPTQEDRELFPDFAGNPDWLAVRKFAKENYKDDSFIYQYLSPKVMRDMRLFTLKDDDRENTYEITSIHNEDGFKKLRATLASGYDFADAFPRIAVAGYNYKGDRSLTLNHIIHNRQPIHEESMIEVMKHIHYLWGHPVYLHSIDENNQKVKTLGVPTKPKVPAPVPFRPGYP